MNTPIADMMPHNKWLAGSGEEVHFDGAFPHLQHLELHGCSCHVAAAMVHAAPLSLRLLALCDMQRGNVAMLQRVSQMTNLRAKSIARSFGSVGAMKLCDLLLCCTNLRYLSLAQCSILPAVMGRLGESLLALTSLRALDVSALQQDAAAEADAGAMGELMEALAGCTALEVWHMVNCLP